LLGPGDDLILSASPALIVGSIMSTLDISIVNLAISRIQNELIAPSAATKRSASANAEVSSSSWQY
jgi:hypothetical protein